MLIANTRGFWSRDGWAELGYEPVDDAGPYADRYAAVAMPRLQGIEFTDPDYRGSPPPE